MEEMRRQSHDVTMLREAVQKLEESRAQAATTEPYPHPNVTPMKRDCACSGIERPTFRQMQKRGYDECNKGSKQIIFHLIIQFKFNTTSSHWAGVGSGDNNN
eukprot:scaffold33626_cov104-Skeletonema_dohrnii-CCMP3373.AAC.3